MVHILEMKGDDATCNSSCFQKTVMLRDWWLIKCPDEFEGKRFGVAGTELMASTERRAMRVFTSAPIVKAVDVWTLETSDGICILLKGLINKERSANGGFSPEIFSHFIFGFPPRWEEISNKCFKGESSSGAGTDSVTLRIHTADRLMSTPCKNKESPLESKIKIGIGENNTAKANDEDSTDDKSGSPELKMAVPREKSGDMIRNTRTGNTAPPVTSEEVKVEQNTVRKSSRLQLKSSENDTENGRKSDTAKVSNPSYCGEHSNSLPTVPTPIMATSNGNFDEAKTVDAENDDRDGSVDDVVSSEVATTVPGESSASQVDGFVKRHTDPASKEKKLRKCSTEESESSGQCRVKGKETRASPCLQSKENGRTAEFAKRENPNKATKSVKSDGKVRALNHSKRKGESKEKCVQDEDWRRINFDVEATPGKQARKEKTAFVSPELSSTKRSRSGRLLVSTLEFWRNQVPVYDARQSSILLHHSHCTLSNRSHEN
ncbi:PREDICTED: uncharacterized protein LOC104816287 isoform X2 [Tarenaya hassleriana]|uniref:uncharacterized protein LOC104816287 isoform X2 n=1 Tax=Tarenaya hassleriana TaxID=28532 RepID=UPI00053C1ACC|nr:PREDICTED: uncharacterized protein LOC104816287 isoform X2 [Tarenaya hassleriana]